MSNIQKITDIPHRKSWQRWRAGLGAMNRETCLAFSNRLGGNVIHHLPKTVAGEKPEIDSYRMLCRAEFITEWTVKPRLPVAAVRKPLHFTNRIPIDLATLEQATCFKSFASANYIWTPTDE